MSDYERRLQWYRDYIARNSDSTSRREREYCDYLKRWFSNCRCDGAPDVEMRILWKRLPMSYNQYFIE